MRSGTRAIVGDGEVELEWADRRYKRTIPISKVSNIPILQSSAGFQKFKTFSAQVEQADNDIYCYDAHIIPDDESIAPPEQPELINDDYAIIPIYPTSEDPNSSSTNHSIPPLQTDQASPLTCIETFKDFENACRHKITSRKKLSLITRPTNSFVGTTSWDTNHLNIFNGWPRLAYSPNGW